MGVTYDVSMCQIIKTSQITKVSFFFAVNGLGQFQYKKCSCRKGRETCSEQVRQSIDNQYGHREWQKNVLWNHERRKMICGPSRRVDLCKEYLRNPHGSHTFQVEVESRKPILT
jgi:hypothetical protein